MTSDVDFSKYPDGLVPVIIQDAASGMVLMLGYMNADALEMTERERRVTFYSRSKKRLWTKGETSGNFLAVKAITTDCDRDALLIQADPVGPVCHTGAQSCFSKQLEPFLFQLERIIRDRLTGSDPNSYTWKLAENGVLKIAQKVGEEGVETALAAVGQGESALCEESADLLYHVLVLLNVKNLSLGQVIEVLRNRHGAPRREQCRDAET